MRLLRRNLPQIDPRLDIHKEVNRMEFEIFDQSDELTPGVTCIGYYKSGK